MDIELEICLCSCHDWFLSPGHGLREIHNVHGIRRRAKSHSKSKHIERVCLCVRVCVRVCKHACAHIYIYTHTRPSCADEEITTRNNRKILMNHVIHKRVDWWREGALDCFRAHIH